MVREKVSPALEQPQDYQIPLAEMSGDVSIADNQSVGIPQSADIFTLDTTLVEAARRRLLILRREAILKDPNIKIVAISRKNGDIDKLPRRQREVIDIRYPEDENVLPRTQKEVAKETMTSRKAAMDKEKKALRNLRRYRRSRRIGGRPQRQDITEELAVETYRRLKSTLKAADELDCNPKTIIRRLEDAGEKINPVGWPRKK